MIRPPNMVVALHGISCTRAFRAFIFYLHTHAPTDPFNRCSELEVPCGFTDSSGLRQVGLQPLLPCDTKGDIYLLGLRFMDSEGDNVNLKGSLSSI